MRVKNVKVYPLASVNKNFKTSTTCLDTLYMTTFRSDTSDGQRSSRQTLTDASLTSKTAGVTPSDGLQGKWQGHSL